MNIKYIEKLLDAGRYGLVIKLLNDNIHLWSVKDFTKLHQTFAYHNEGSDVVAMYMMKYFPKYKCIDERDLVDSEIYFRHDMYTTLKTSDPNPSKYIYDNTGYENYSFLNKASMYDATNYFRYLTCDIMFKLHPYISVSYTDSDYIHTSNFIIDNTCDVNIAKFILCDHICNMLEEDDYGECIAYNISDLHICEWKLLVEFLISDYVTCRWPSMLTRRKLKNELS